MSKISRLASAAMRASATTDAAAHTSADTIVVGLVEGEPIAHDVEDGALQALVEAGEAKPRFKHLAVTHAAGKRWILVGLGARDRLDDERLRVAAAVALDRARELGTATLCWELPHKLREGHPARAVVEGTLMAAYRFAGFKRKDDEDDEDGDGGTRPAELIVSD